MNGLPLYVESAQFSFDFGFVDCSLGVKMDLKNNWAETVALKEKGGTGVIVSNINVMGDFNVSYLEWGK